MYLMTVTLPLSLQPTHLANFNQVQSIQYSALDEKDRKGMLQLNVAGAPEVKTHTLYILHLALCVCYNVKYNLLLFKFELHLFVCVSSQTCGSCTFSLKMHIMQSLCANKWMLFSCLCWLLMKSHLSQRLFPSS